MPMRSALVISLFLALPLLYPLSVFPQSYSGDAIPEPLTQEAGNVMRGRAVVASRQTGLCLLCHSGPFPEERFQGNLAPDLLVSSARLSSPQLRARLVDASRFNPNTIMPAYFRVNHLNRVAPQFTGKTILSAQEIEDVISFLASLKQ
ncbi:sulfur oxidation c-type cytochrome SoxX [Polynucleobacter sp. IMCC30063]|uniref:sulfur oxidation c-type cytochrome SoxX n=1 Tax=Polynucleobacter sp. IMCC30063 TaxID=2907298 RepID=UPI001F23BD8E|nr:sulfur oxidation c-type cytochrome SoxX [Polynucleobacter sp. IMCC30063]MCE7506270.1 sulfur oxidation c-type cytochrome SoxX [Polynucleobacter sp. IMCC30063]